MKPLEYRALPPPKSDAVVDAKAAAVPQTLAAPEKAAEPVPSRKRGRPAATTTEATPATAAASAAVMSDDEITKALGL